jgi:RHS repeat-associated protein
VAWRKEYSTSSSTTIESWKRYEFDGINLLRMDERCDTDGDGVIEAGETTWRTLEVSTHRPGLLGNQLGKRVYTHTNNDYTPDDTDDYFYGYFYGYDRVGNVAFVYHGGENGEEAFHFSQDAFGNEIDLGSFDNDDWTTTAATYGVTEHQTGKWMDSFTGLYFFHARWYDSFVGRFVSRDPILQIGGDIYSLSSNAPLKNGDPTGLCPGCGPGSASTNSIRDLLPPSHPANPHHPRPPKSPLTAWPPDFLDWNCGRAADRAADEWNKKFPAWNCVVVPVNPVPFLSPPLFYTHFVVVCYRKDDPSIAWAVNTSPHVWPGYLGPGPVPY